MLLILVRSAGCRGPSQHAGEQPASPQTGPRYRADTYIEKPAHTNNVEFKFPPSALLRHRFDKLSRQLTKTPLEIWSFTLRSYQISEPASWRRRLIPIFGGLRRENGGEIANSFLPKGLERRAPLRFPSCKRWAPRLPFV